MRTSNPALNSKVFTGFGPTISSDTMTLQGTVNKAGILALLLMLGATWTWKILFSEGYQALYPWLIAGALGGFVVALVTVFKKEWSPFTAPLYAILEGLFLGGLSSMLEVRYPGIVIQAVGLTFGVFIALLLAYTTRVVKATENFKLGVFAATGGITVVYFISFIMGLFGVQIPFIHSSGTIGILFSLFVVIVAALNLVLDFDFIENGAQAGVPKFMEWYAAFGLLVTLVWLYIEILRLLSKLRGRD